MLCPVCKKNVKRGKLFIGYVHQACLKTEKVDFAIKKASTPSEMKQIEKLYFIEMGKWYDVRKMENLVAIKNKKVLGFASWKKEGAGLFLLVILVQPKYFRLGIATALLDKIKALAEKLKVKSIIAPISNDDLTSYVFYQDNGFRLSGIDLRLAEKRHHKEEEGFWGLPCRDEFYLEYRL